MFARSLRRGRRANAPQWHHRRVGRVATTARSSAASGSCVCSQRSDGNRLSGRGHAHARARRSQDPDPRRLGRRSVPAAVLRTGMRARLDLDHPHVVGSSGRSGRRPAPSRWASRPGSPRNSARGGPSSRSVAPPARAGRRTPSTLRRKRGLPPGRQSRATSRSGDLEPLASVTSAWRGTVSSVRVDGR